MKAYLVLFFALLFALLPGTVHAAAGQETKIPEFKIRMEAFPQQEAAAGVEGIGAKLAFRAKEQPFLLVATVIFLLAIVRSPSWPTRPSTSMTNGS